MRPNLPPARGSQLTLRAALAVVRAIKKTTGLAAKIKWPNDVLVAGKKVCGILSEMSSEPDAIHFVVLGVGINVNVSQTEFPAKIRETATSLSAQAHHPVSRIDLICRYLEEMETLYLSLRENGFAPILEEIKKSCDSLGRLVEIHTTAQNVSGQAVDIDADGALVLRREHGKTEKIYCGDLQVI